MLDTPVEAISNEDEVWRFQFSIWKAVVKGFRKQEEKMQCR
jgi:hypothetical protein